MDQKGEIRLDPDVLELDMEDGEVTRAPLSDLYELPVFAEETMHKAGKCQTEEKQMLEGIRQGVFGTEGRTEEEKLERIHSRIFQEIPVVSTVEGSISRTSPPEMNEKTETLQGAFLFPGIIVAGLTGIFVWRCSLRRRKSDREGNACLNHRTGGVGQ